MHRAYAIFFLNLILSRKCTKINRKTHKGVKIVEVAYFKVSEIAKMTGISAEVIRKWCRTGKLKASKPGGKDYLIKRVDFDEFMASTETKDK